MGYLCQYCKDELDDNITDSKSSKSKAKKSQEEVMFLETSKI